MKKFTSFKLYPGIYKKLPPSDACIVITLLTIICIQTLFLAYKLNDHLLFETTIRYGEINEGIVGVPTYKNPLYGINTAEKDIVSLIHAGLLKHDNTGNFVPHLAATWSEEDSNVYRFTLKKGISFHDGTPITTKDVVHTVAMVQEEQKYNNPYYSAWADVQVHAEDDLNLTITIPEGNLYFPERFTMPILPEHVWRKIPKEKRKRYKGPGAYIGAGPYRHEQEAVTLDEQPISITLTGFSGYALGRPFIEKIMLHFFVDTEDLLQAYELGIIDGVHGVTAIDLTTLLEQRQEKTDKVYAADTTRVFGVFFNTEDGRILQDSFLRSVLSQWVKREQIVTEVFKGYATPIQAPLATDTTIKESDITLEQLSQTLEDIGWKFEAATGKRERNSVPLEITFVMPDTEETKEIAGILINGWQRMGISVKTEILPEKEASDVIESKKFDAMLYGYKANTIKDLVELWKSGDTENLASITSFGSPTLNDLLADLEKNTPPKRFAEQLSKAKHDDWEMMVYNEIKVEMEKSVPAIFLYSPHFLYVLPETVKGVGLNGNHLGRIHNASDRFLNAHSQYFKKEKVWKFLMEN